MKKNSPLDEPVPFVRIYECFPARLLVALFLLIAATPGIAQTLYWDQNGATAGTGGTGNWNGGSTWRDGSDTGTLGAWSNGGNAVLAGTSGTVTINTASVSMGTLTVNTSGYTIASTSSTRTLTATAGLVLAANVALIFNQNSTAAGNWSLGNITFGTGASLTLQGNANAGNASRISLSQAATTISGGSITLAGANLGPTGFVATASGVVLNTNITNNAADSHTMLGATSGNSLTYGGVLSGSSGLQISAGESGGDGIVTLSTAASYAGNTFLNHGSNGVFRLGVANALPSSTTVTLAQSSATGGTAGSGALDLAGFNLTVAGVNGAGRGIVNTGSAATLTLGGSGTYTLTSQIGIPSSTTNLTGANNNITVVKNGTGTQTLSGSKAFTGGLYINSGILRVTGSVAAFGGAPASPAAAVFLRGGTLVVDATVGDMDSSSNRGFEVGPTSGFGTVTIQVDGANSFIANGTIADTPGGSGRIIKTGTGILRLVTTAKTFTGGISILEGAVSLSLDSRIGAVPVVATPGSILINGGTLLATDSFTLHANRGIALGPDTGSGGGIISVSSGTLTYEGVIANNGSGAGRLIKAGAGTLRLQSSTNTFSGGLTILAGDVSVGAIDDRLGAVPVSATPGSILINGGALTVTGDLTLSSNRGIALGPDTGSGSGTFNVTGTSTLTYGGIIADNPGGSGRLVKTGTGTLRLISNPNTFTGGLTVTGGLLSFSLENRLGAAPGSPTAGSIVLNGGGLRLTLNDVTLGSNRGIALGPEAGSGSGILNVDADVSLTYNGIIANNGLGSGSLEKTEAGGLHLGGANTYTGGTTLTGGSLLVTNTTGSATGSGGVTTASGTTLGGTGIIAPTGTNGIIIDGSVAPGVSGMAGTLTFTPVDANVTFQNTSSVAFELFGNGSNDKIVFIASGSGVIDFSALANGSIGVTFAGGYTPALGHSFNLLDWSLAGMSGLSASMLNASSAGFDPSWSWDTSAFVSDGVITIVLVPEPARSLFLAAGTMAFVLRRRR